MTFWRQSRIPAQALASTYIHLINPELDYFLEFLFFERFIYLFAIQSCGEEETDRKKNFHPFINFSVNAMDIAGLETESFIWSTKQDLMLLFPLRRGWLWSGGCRTPGTPIWVADIGVQLHPPPAPTGLQLQHQGEPWCCLKCVDKT